jgi:pimeloyl-ACP methyl ester carboxylesterase
MREILQVEVCGTKLVGTYHVAADAAAAAHPHDTGQAPVGVLLLNAAQLPRAGLADMSVEMADRLADRGYPVFRFDLPGLGDSPGDLPEYVLEEWRRVQDGEYALFASALVDQLNRQFGLRGIVLGGLCGGAITSVYASERCESGVVGLALLEMSFFLSNHTAAGDASPSPRMRMRDRAGIRQMRQALRDRVLATPLGKPARATYALMKRTRDFILGPALPADANLPLVESCRRLAARRLPMLVVTAGSKFRTMIRRGVWGRDRDEPITFVEVEGTNHMLIPGGGKQAVIEHVEAWISAGFTLEVGRIDSPANACRQTLAGTSPT